MKPNKNVSREFAKNTIQTVFLPYALIPNIIIMGKNFNDYPYNKSISEVLNAKAPSHRLR